MRIEHIAMYVNDLEAAREFFVKYLDGHSNAGYHNAKTGFSSYFIRFEDGARLELMNKPDVTETDKTSERMGYTHIALTFRQRYVILFINNSHKSGVKGMLHSDMLNGRQMYSITVLSFMLNMFSIRS